jgi:hypothetical protein
VREVCHGDEVREAVLVHDGPPVDVVKAVAFWPVRPARLPVVVQPNVRVAEVGQGRWHAIDRARAVRDERHLRHHQALVDVATKLRLSVYLIFFG